MNYYLDLDQPLTSHSPIPCTFVPSVEVGKTLLCRESDGACMVVEPDGTQTRWELPGTDGYDSPYTRATALGGFLVFRSAAPAGTPPPEDKGVSRMYKMVA